MKQEVWGFVEKWYPNYYSSDEILRSDLLERIVSEEFKTEESERIFKEEFNSDIELVKKELSEVNLSILEKTIERYIEIDNRMKYEED